MPNITQTDERSRTKTQFSCPLGQPLLTGTHSLWRCGGNAPCGPIPERGNATLDLCTLPPRSALPHLTGWLPSASFQAPTLNCDIPSWLVCVSQRGFQQLSNSVAASQVCTSLFATSVMPASALRVPAAGDGPAATGW